jgi:hypothetical protein
LDVALRKWREKEEPPISPTTTALRFILKDGRRLQRRFERDTLFKDVLEYVSLQLDGMSFVLDSTYPRRRYDEDDGEATLAELGMVPQFTFAVVYT